MDGHHEVCRARGHGIPSLFGVFVGYNMPELSKHRKRQVENMSSEVLQQHSKQLFLALQASFWQRSAWRPFQKDVESLARSISEYAQYLEEKNKQMKFYHAQSETPRSVGENLYFTVLPVSTDIAFTAFKSVEEALKAKELYQHIPLIDHIPQEPSKKYELMKRLKRVGLPFPAALLTYQGDASY